jgi:hypothetical protein
MQMPVTFLKNQKKNISILHMKNIVYYVVSSTHRSKPQMHRKQMVEKIFHILPQLLSATTTTLSPYFSMHSSTCFMIVFNRRSIASKCFCVKIGANGSELIDSCKTSLSFLSLWLSRVFNLCHVERRILMEGGTIKVTCLGKSCEKKSHTTNF